jgi:hypothetical protein
LTASVNKFAQRLSEIDVELDVVAMQFVDTNTSTCLPPYDGTMDWYNEMQTLKGKTSIDAGSTLNVLYFYLFVGTND